MKKTILFLEQQSWLSGAQRVLESVLDATAGEYDPIVAFPGEGEFSRKLADRNIRTLWYPLGFYQTGRKSRAEMLAFAARSLMCAFKLANVIQRKRVSLVYINGPRCMLAGVLAARITGRPALFHLHLNLVRKPEILLVAHLARYVSAIVSCSQTAAAGILRANGSLSGRTHILYNPLAACASATRDLPDSQQPGGNSSAITVGAVGRITKPKGQRVLLNALGKLSAQDKAKIRVIFIGAPSPDNREDLNYLQRLKECVAQFELQGSIEWAGYQAAVGPFYRAIDVLIQPSLSDSGESMPLSMLEALQHGVPVIASSTGGVPEVIHHGSNGLLVPPGDAVALANTLERFLRDAKLRAHLRAGANSSIDDRFSPENFKSKIRELIWKLCTTQQSGNPEAIREESAA
ncbi:MAG TPA: glycosyltransferase family 4 protein [Terriglobia bacterium]|nr:glycosyltransferase family 4 protein [Terriglobia bacterium]